MSFRPYQLDTHRDLFQTLWELKPIYKSYVQVYNKESNAHENKQIYRSYRSYGKTPKLDENVKKSYMFSGYQGDEISKDMPTIIEKLLKAAKSHDERYNQVVVNWYEHGDYIELHSDCDAKMVDHYKIAMFHYCHGNDNYSVLQHKETGAINIEPIFNNTFVYFDKNFNSEYRHGSTVTNSPRISVTFRMMRD